MDESLLLGLYTADAMQKVDGMAIQGIGIPGGHLMERAGLAVATEILERYAPEEAVVFAGKGNNGGDGFVVARELFDAGVEVTVLLLASPDEYQGDARLNLDVLGRLGVDVRPATGEDGALTDDAMMLTEMADVVVDAIFGTGFTGAAKGTAAAAIGLINEAPGAVVSVDIMSGVGAGAGTVHGPAVEADLTVALHAAKVGHFVLPGGALSGEVVIAPIGIPSLCDVDPTAWLLTDEAVGELVVPKGSLDHKRSVGTVLVVGGSKGMEGAAHMAAFAALRGGAGLVHVALPEGAGTQKPFAEVISVTVPGEDGQFGLGARAALFEQAGQLKAAAVGPGFGRADGAVALVRELLGIDVPLLLDADGLYALGQKLELLAERHAPTVITPHEGELGRLIGRPAAEVAAQRLECAVSAAHRSNATVVLKGEATIVADPSGTAYVVPTGNPGLATPGSGDVLSGVIVAQLAKGLPATEAACLGAYLHGLAADLAAEEAVGTESMVASDLFHYLPAAVERLKAGPQEESHEHEH
ncbi:MAG TPA: NAD(P)H-hydrate dehydratase [Thermoleophilia bacterium]|nr:NAD(P)H-hydrate dehydratase [Thermoleophilia bacterium]